MKMDQKKLWVAPASGGFNSASRRIAAERVRQEMK
jgi:hypothetical protein